MPDTEVQVQPAVSTEGASESPTPLLDSYMNAMQERMPQPAAPAPVESGEPKREEAPALVTEEPKAPEPTPRRRFADILKDPEYAREAQSEIDRRAAAAARAQAQQQRERIAAEERARAEQELRNLAELAAKPDSYDPEVQAARERLGALTFERMQREQMDMEARRIAEELAAEREVAARMGVVQNLDDAYQRAYIEVPELRGFDGVHHTRFDNATDWVKAVADRVRDQATADAEKTFESRIAKAIEERLPQELARYRSTLPNPDVVAATGTGGGGSWRSSSEVERAFNQGEATAAQVRWARANLPYE